MNGTSLYHQVSTAKGSPLASQVFSQREHVPIDPVVDEQIRAGLCQWLIRLAAACVQRATDAHASMRSIADESHKVELVEHPVPLDIPA